MHPNAIRNAMRAVIVSLIVWTTPAVAAISAGALLHEIDTLGPRAVMSRLAVDRAQFDQICAQIESGDPQWLEVARRLKGVSDGGASLSLSYAVARAIPAAPSRVLALIDHGFTVDDVCGSPFIEPDPGVADEYKRRALLALRSVSAFALQTARNQCLAKIESPNGTAAR
jgi:hypothetical protein